ncbi:dolichyl-diphosphooligosaccharide--protein glycosyltransferase subunit 2 isoform X2 [Ischnura elegans]|uniref:dolichyl-diphosphooligosaccharide--protein glycosyltransferase subunit 2 isoform X2 n=1 Tax=Ischnura elegans TaxID=197161 RepID=UPI001ED8A317|nr:dolichyl-diphosphooligosaccharide--protein glycosyltransferase subunit 2 isoform X2 [Ischnura elegans]
MKLRAFLLAAFALAVVGHAGSTNVASYLSVSDKARLKLVFTNAFQTSELNSLFYAISGYNILKEPIPSVQDKCKFIISSVSSPPSVEAGYYAIASWKTLGTCQGNLPKTLAKVASDVIYDETSSIVDLYYAVHVLQNLNEKVPDVKKLVKQLQAALKKDDSLLNMGYTFHIAAALGAQEGKFAFERIEDAIVQADEVDGKLLQFEGGLSITALIVSGAYRLSDVVGKAPPITNVQAVKFANYFLSRKSVQLPKGAYHLLQVLRVFTDNKFHIPVCVTMAGGRSLTKETPMVSVRVSNVFGEVLPALEGKVPSVIADSAIRLVGPTQDIGSAVTVMSGKPLSPVASDKTLYELNLLKEGSGVERGFYELVVSVGGTVDPRLVGLSGAHLPLKVLGPVSLEAAEIGTADADQTTAPKLIKCQHPNKLATIVEADRHQKLMLRFTLKDIHSNKISLAHQAFVRLTNLKTSQEIVFVAEPDQSKVYRFDMDVSGRAGDFNHLSGKYSLDLVVGDATISNAISWPVADVLLKFSDSQAAEQPKEASPSPYLPKPEIQHLFREPEKRPPVMVSNLFTGLVCLPLLILFGLWLKLGINISAFPLSLSAIGFHLGLGGIFALFGVFWLQLNMFQTLKYLLAVGVVTFLCGNKMLSKIASERKH